jgi:hypothetical protein
MGQRVYVLSQDEYSNILGIFTNIRQCRKFIENFENKDQIILHEIRLNEPNKGKKDMTKLLKENTFDDTFTDAVDRRQGRRKGTKENEVEQNCIS